MPIFLCKNRRRILFKNITKRLRFQLQDRSHHRLEIQGGPTVRVLPRRVHRWAHSSGFPAVFWGPILVVCFSPLCCTAFVSFQRGFNFTILSGLRIRSIFGRIRQIRILKTGSESYLQYNLKSIQTCKFFSYQSDFFRYFYVDFCSAVNPDPVGSEIICRIRIRNY